MEHGIGPKTAVTEFSIKVQFQTPIEVYLNAPTPEVDDEFIVLAVIARIPFGGPLMKLFQTAGVRSAVPVGVLPELVTVWHACHV